MVASAWISGRSSAVTANDPSHQTTASRMVARLINRRVTDMHHVPSAAAQAHAAAATGTPPPGVPNGGRSNPNILATKQGNQDQQAAQDNTNQDADSEQQAQSANTGDVLTTTLNSIAGSDILPQAARASTSYQPRGATGNATATTSQTVSTSGGFAGMAESNAICPPWGCSAPDNALASSPNWVFQGVNTSFAVYNSAGAPQAGWPKTAQQFFGIPSLSCASVPYTVDPRAFYDPVDGRFWAAILQNENALWQQTGCAFMSRVWIAVSQTSDPTGAWNVYSFDLANSTTNAADFSELGFDAQAVYFTANMWTQTGSSFQYPEVLAMNKALMEQGASVTPAGFTNLKLNGVAVDTVQPVEMLDTGGSAPNAGLLIDSTTYNFNYECNNGCHGVVVWAIANPTSTTPTLTSTFVNTSTYYRPPYADQPGCTKCLDTDQSEITATPVYRNGSIWFSLNSAGNNGTQSVPGIYWGQVTPTLSSAGALTSGTLAQSGFFSFSGDTAAYYGALMPDAAGDVAMVFERSGNTVNPEMDYVTRPAGYAAGKFPDGGTTVRAGDAKTSEQLWGALRRSRMKAP
jgi:hypothetical protein